jgi:phosphoribosylanthranilate isomerase
LSLLTVVKICGITNLEDALGAVAAGADALGFNFYPASPRYIAPAAARAIIAHLPPKTLTVGVFVNEPRERLLETVSATGIAAVQLHGDESPAYCETLGETFVIKALRVGADFDVAETQRYAVGAVLLDAADRKVRGGTGKVIDWSVARAAREQVAKLFLAGGLSHENVREALIAVNPYAVDACSGLELTPGRKDSERVRWFVAAVRTFDEDATVALK